MKITDADLDVLRARIIDQPGFLALERLTSELLGLITENAELEAERDRLKLVWDVVSDRVDRVDGRMIVVWALLAEIRASADSLDASDERIHNFARGLRVACAAIEDAMNVEVGA